MAVDTVWRIHYLSDEATVDCIVRIVHTDEIDLHGCMGDVLNEEGSKNLLLVLWRRS